MNYIIGIDIGTTSTKAIAFNRSGEEYFKASRDNNLVRDSDGRAEQDSQQLISDILDVIRSISRRLSPEDCIQAITFSCQMHSLIALDKSFHPLTASMTWADGRARAQAKSLKLSAKGDLFFQKTGTPIHSMTWLNKIAYLQEKSNHFKEPICHFMGIKEYLFYNLFGVNKIDLSSATGTGLVNISSEEWDEEILEFLGIDVSFLPEIVSTIDYQNGLPNLLKEVRGLTDNTLFIFGAGDGPMANLGVGATDGNTAVVTVGTSSAIRIVTKKKVVDPRKRLFTYALLNNQWVVGGASNSGGNILEWLSNNLYSGEKIDKVLKDIASVPLGSNGLICYPYFGGERAPLWDEERRGEFLNLNFNHSRKDMARAAIEGVFFNIKAILEDLESLAESIETLYVTGGLFKTDFFLELLADVTGKKVRKVNDSEVGCRAAYYLSLLALENRGNLQALGRNKSEEITIIPTQKNKLLYNTIYQNKFLPNLFR
jgi:gluconokinase